MRLIKDAPGDGKDLFDVLIAQIVRFVTQKIQKRLIYFDDLSVVIDR